jgi:glycosyltransferase involved in cell wall biosynthesis
VAVAAGLTAAFWRARSLDLIIHEINYGWGRRASVRKMIRTMFWATTRVLVHTATEKRLLCEAFALPQSSVTLIQHGSDFIRRTEADRGAARRLLGVKRTFIFLAIGFVQPHKGYDRAIRAFDDLGSSGCRLYIVGHTALIEAPEMVPREPFVVRAGTPRDAVMEAIRQRAGHRRLPQPSKGAVAVAPQLAPLLRLPHLRPPSIESRSRSTHRKSARTEGHGDDSQAETISRTRSRSASREKT